MNSVDRDTAILVVSCDAYRDLWCPFFSCFFKYWPDCPFPVYLGSNDAIYPDPRVQPITVGTDVDYSSNLIQMLKAIEQEWVILWIDDRLLSAPVDTQRIQRLVRRVQDQNSAYLKLLANHPYSFDCPPLEEIGEVPRGQRYRVCLTVALWRKTVLAQLLVPGETAWDIERDGTQRSTVYDSPFLALAATARKNPPIREVHLVTKGRLIRGVYSFLRREGLESRLNHRPKQSLTSYLYLKSYLLFWESISVLRAAFVSLQVKT